MLHSPPESSSLGGSAGALEGALCETQGDIGSEGRVGQGNRLISSILRVQGRGDGQS